MCACEESTMRTISLINQKGGVGKTTVALHLAAAFWQGGQNVVVLDLDPQAFAVLNSVPPHGTVADEAAEMIETTLHLPVCPIRLGDRVAYNRCLITGHVAQEYEPAGKAAHEVEQLYMWACAQLNMTAC